MLQLNLVRDNSYKMLGHSVVIGARSNLIPQPTSQTNQPAMPGRLHVESDDVLGAVSTAMEITESITDLVHVPIASTVASLVSVVLKAAKVGLSCHFK